MRPLVKRKGIKALYMISPLLDVRCLPSIRRVLHIIAVCLVLKSRRLAGKIVIEMDAGIVSQAQGR